jgi:D-threonate/D-erythronate kinase
MRLLILADDLSGAADAGLACAQAGLETRVILGGRDGDAEVLCIDADTRHLSAQHAAAMTAGLLSRHAVEGAAIYKKIDSTLRGNWAAELAALLKISGDEARAVLAPAFPAMGRVMRNGQQFVHGTPLDQTEIWRHEKRPGSAMAAEMLGALGIQCRLIELPTVRGPAADLAAALEAAPGVALCDAETEGDLAAIALASVRSPERPLWCGSGGLAQPLPAALGLDGGYAAWSRPPPVIRPILFLVGSRSALATTQRTHLLAGGGVRHIILEAGQEAEATRAVEATLAAGDDLLVTLTEAGHEAVRSGETACQGLARFVSPWNAAIGALVATGGETARAALEQQGASGLRLIGAVAQGVPLGIIDGPWPLPCVTKAGAFGDPDILSRARRVLRSGALPREGSSDD